MLLLFKHVEKKTSDMTRNTICKSVAIISTHPTLGCIRSKLGVVTEALFNQKDLADLDILKV